MLLYLFNNHLLRPPFYLGSLDFSHYDLRPLHLKSLHHVSAIRLRLVFSIRLESQRILTFFDIAALINVVVVLLLFFFVDKSSGGLLVLTFNNLVHIIRSKSGILDFYFV